MSPATATSAFSPQLDALLLTGASASVSFSRRFCPLLAEGLHSSTSSVRASASASASVDVDAPPPLASLPCTFSFPSPRSLRPGRVSPACPGSASLLLVVCPLPLFPVTRPVLPPACPLPVPRRPVTSPDFPFHPPLSLPLFSVSSLAVPRHGAAQQRWRHQHPHQRRSYVQRRPQR